MAIQSAAVTLQSALVTLGRFELWVHGRAAPPPPTHKARALAAFLVADQGHDVARERILELFWNDFEPERAREGLRTALSSIRHALRSAHDNADELLFADKSVVRWVGNTEFDVRRFDELARSEDVNDKQAALKVYGGDFLEGTYEEWAVSERERIAGIYEALLADLVSRTNDVHAARLLLARNPFHEQAYATLIHAQLEANRPAAAAELLAQYRAAMLEINAEPSPEFRDRFAHVQERSTLERAARHVESAMSATLATPPSRTNLPLQLTSFVGRDDDLAQVKNLLRRSRLITLAGPGGIGKTRLALEAGAGLREHFADGVWFVDFASVSDPHYVASAIASALGIWSGAPGRTVQDALLAALQKRRMLLILDNCEHLVTAAARTCEAILQNCPDVCVVATSREPLSIAGEDVVRLSALAEEHAVALFVERAKAAEKKFELNDRNAAIVNTICRRLDGIPLAIELAAPRVSILSLARLQAELEEHFRILTTGSSTALPRHKTMRALIDWSYELLSPAEQALLRRTGVFAGGFTVRAAQWMFGQDFPDCDVLDVLSPLVTKSLMLADADAQQERYRLLQITQQYATEKLRELSELPPAREEHAQYFLTLMREADDSYGASNAREWLLRYQPEIDNVRAAIEYCIESGNACMGAELIAAARDLWQELGLHAEAMHRARHALEVLPENAAPSSRAGLWLVLAQTGNSLYLTPQALEAGQHAREAFETLADAPHLAYASQSVGFSLARAGIHEDAEVALVHAQNLAEQLGNRRLFMRALLRRAQNIYTGRTLKQSLPLYERALVLARALEDDLYEGYILGHMGDAYFALDDPERAILLARSAKAIFERRRDTSQEAVALTNLAVYHLAVGDFAAAKESARRGAILAREAESPVNSAAAVQHLGALAAVERHPHIAARLLGFSDQAFTGLYFSRTHTECASREKALQLLREQLPDAEIDALLKEGAALSGDEAQALALSW